MGTYTVSIPLTGIAANYRKPGNFAEVLFGQGPSTASGGVRKVLITGPMLGSGAAWTAGTMVQVKSEADAIAGAGAGSPLHRAIRAFLLANSGAVVYALPYAASSGGTPVAATGTITITGTPTASGVIQAMVCGETVQAGYSTSDSLTTIAANLTAAINAKTYLPCAATSSAGVITLTARIAGASQGTATLGVIRFRASIVTGAGLTVAVSGAALGMGTGTAGADGSTAEASNLTSALANVLSANIYYYVCASTSATIAAALANHLLQKALPISGRRQVGFLGYTGSLASCITLANGTNYERVRYAWQANSEHDTAELAGYWAGVVQAHENYAKPNFNFDGYRAPDFLIKRAYSTSDWPNDQDQNDAINNGITCFASDDAGAFCVMSVNSRSKNSAGTVADFRATETHRVSIMDQFTDDLLVRIANNFGGQALMDDQRNTKGEVNKNQRVPQGSITPSRMLPTIYGLIDDYAKRGQLKNAEDAKKSIQIGISSTTAGRVECSMDLETCDLFHQSTFRIAEVSAA